jgi:hypothetical protein
MSNRFINKSGYLELLNRLRPPLMALRAEISDMDDEEFSELSKKLISHVGQLEKFMDDVTFNLGWEITEDTDCWNSGTVDPSELKQHKNIVRAHSNSQVNKKI